MKIKEAMNPNVITIDANATPLMAFQKMYKEGIRRLFVTDNGKPQGIISYTDLIGVFGNKVPKKIDNPFKIADIMSKDIMAVSINDEIVNAANLMIRADISGLLVLDNEKPVGVITKTDICRLVAAELLVPVR